MKPEEINVAKDDGGTAFPFQPFGQDGGAMSEAQSGMSLRDYLAAKAMDAYIHKVLGDTLADDLGDPDKQDYEKYIALSSYQMADAMLKARIGKWVETKGEGE